MSKVRSSSVYHQDKAFAKNTEGVVLGVCYNLMDWKWWLDRKNVAVEQDNGGDDDNGEMMTMVGKLNHYHMIVP